MKTAKFSFWVYEDKQIKVDGRPVSFFEKWLGF